MLAFSFYTHSIDMLSFILAMTVCEPTLGCVDADEPIDYSNPRPGPSGCSSSQTRIIDHHNDSDSDDDA